MNSGSADEEQTVIVEDKDEELQETTKARSSRVAASRSRRDGSPKDKNDCSIMQLTRVTVQLHTPRKAPVTRLFGRSVGLCDAAYVFARHLDV